MRQNDIQSPKQQKLTNDECKISNCEEQNISFMNETKWYEIWLRLKGWVQKIFQTSPPNFRKGLN